MAALRAPHAWRGPSAAEMPAGPEPADAPPVNDNVPTPLSAIIAGRAFHFILSLGAIALAMAAIVLPLAGAR